MGFEVKTIWLVAGILLMTSGLLVVALRRRYVGHLGTALRFWGSSYLCIGAAFLFSAQTPRLVYFLAMITLGGVGMILQFVAVTELKQQKLQVVWVWLPLTAIGGSYLAFGLIHPNTSIVLTLFNLIRAAILLRTTFSFLQRENGERPFVDVLAGGIYLLLATSAIAVAVAFIRHSHFAADYDFQSIRTIYNVTSIAVAQTMLFTIFLLGFAERLNLKFKEQAMHDPLTNLFNRRAMTEIGLHQESLCARTGQALSVFMIDVDHFKQINDEHGHAAGDSILKSVAMAIGRELRMEDYLGRWGGDEFCVLLPGMTRENAALVAKRLVHGFDAMSWSIDQKQVRFGISIGIASREDCDSGFTDLIAMADAALYRAKQAGRRRYAFAPLRSEEKGAMTAALMTGQAVAE